MSTIAQHKKQESERLFHEGLSYAQIALRLKCCKKALAAHLKSVGLVRQSNAVLGKRLIIHTCLCGTQFSGYANREFCSKRCADASRVKWSQDTIIQAIRRNSIDGIIKTNGLATLTTVASRMFGSWRAACAQAGVGVAADCVTQYSKCTVDGCQRKPRSTTSPYCETHYYRIYRNGTLDLHKPPAIVDRSDGYRLLYAPKHPLRRSSSRIAEHRAVFYEAHGAGPFNCHWCDKPLTWQNLHIDHLNDIRSDNSIGNLVASCPPCNQKRGHSKVKRTMRERYGFKITFNGLTLSVGDWAEQVSIPAARIKKRLIAGWRVEDALTLPKRVRPLSYSIKTAAQDGGFGNPRR